VNAIHFVVWVRAAIAFRVLDERRLSRIGDEYFDRLIRHFSCHARVKIAAFFRYYCAEPSG
jgi:hypothetical protein